MMLRSKQSIEEYTIRKIQIYLEFLINNIAERHKNEKKIPYFKELSNSFTLYRVINFLNENTLPMTKNIYLYVSSIDHLLKTFSIDQLLQTTRTLNSNLFNLGLPKEVLYWEEYFGEGFDGIVSRIEELESDSKDEFKVQFSSIGILRSEIELNDSYYGFKSKLDNVSLAILIQAQIDFGMNELQRRAQEEYDIQQDCEYNEEEEGLENYSSPIKCTSCEHYPCICSDPEKTSSLDDWSVW